MTLFCSLWCVLRLSEHDLICLNDAGGSLIVCVCLPFAYNYILIISIYALLSWHVYQCVSVCSSEYIHTGLWLILYSLVVAILKYFLSLPRCVFFSFSSLSIEAFTFPLFSFSAAQPKWIGQIVVLSRINLRALCP